MILPHKISTKFIKLKFMLHSSKNHLPEDLSVELTKEVLQKYLEHCQALHHHTIEIRQS